MCKLHSKVVNGAVGSDEETAPSDRKRGRKDSAFPEVGKQGRGEKSKKKAKVLVEVLAIFICHGQIVHVNCSSSYCFNLEILGLLSY